MSGAGTVLSQPGEATARVGALEAPMLVVDRVVKRYGANTVLDGVSFRLNRGEVVCLIGPSGSGKSTVLRCLNALEPVDGGRIIFEGIDLSDRRTDARKLRQRMGMVFQSFELFPHLLEFQPLIH